MSFREEMIHKLEILRYILALVTDNYRAENDPSNILALVTDNYRAENDGHTFTLLHLSFYFNSSQRLLVQS